MSVIPMQKVRLVVYNPDVNQALSAIQKAGALEFTPTLIEDLQEPEESFKYADLLPRVQHAVQFLEPYAPKKSLWRTLREGTRDEFTEAELLKRKASIDVAYPLVEDFERLQVEFAEVNERLRVLEEQHALLTDWKNLPIRLADLRTELTKTILVTGGTNTTDSTLVQLLSTELEKTDLAFAITEVTNQSVALTFLVDNEIAKTIDEVLTNIKAEVVVPPNGVETPETELTAVAEKLAATKGELALLYDQAEHFAITHLRQLQILGEILTWHKARYEVVDQARSTKYTTVFDGWLNKNKQTSIEHDFAKHGVAAVFSDLELKDGEVPPVDIENNSLVRPFEAVTRLYGMPGHTDLDPTVFLAAFFFLFFGLSLTDVGYGLFLMVVSTIVITLFKVSDAIKLFAKLLFLVGLSTVIVGALFGGYFGVSPENLPPFLQALQLFDPIGNPLPVFYLALGLGVFQVMVGMLVKIYSEYTQGRFVSGLLDQGPWFFVFCMAVLTLLTTVSAESLNPFMVWYSSIAPPLAITTNLIYVGLVLVVLSAGRKGETILVKIKDSLSALYDSIGYFSDILSYSRLLALGLATTALAFAVNMIAGMVFNKESYISYVLAGAILIIGHLFTLAVNTLGAFIHSARLQFVEFFGKFIVGTGREFHPLSRTEKHITVKDE